MRVLFVCVGNSCRSQMAHAFAEHLGAGLLDVRSAGTHPSARVMPDTIAVMREAGVPIPADRQPRLLQPADMDWADLVVGMGCEIACPMAPGKPFEDWGLPDPVSQSIETYRKVRDDIRRRVEALVADAARRRA